MNVTSLTHGASTLTPAATSSSSTSGASFQAMLDAQKSSSSAADSIAAYVKMTPAQRMRANALKELGLTEDDLKNMSPDQAKAAEAKIADLIKMQAQQATPAVQSAQAVQSIKGLSVLG
jgi:hypothetical protein